jgi:hypothetical protein
MAPDLRVPISDILLALDEQPDPPSRSRGPIDAIPDGFILAQSGSNRPPLDARVGAGLVLENASASYQRIAQEQRETQAKAKDESARGAVRAKPARAANPSQASAQQIFLGLQEASQSISPPPPTRIGDAPRVHNWKNLLGLLIALLIAGFGFLGLLRAAGVRNLPGEAIIDRIPTVFSGSSTSAPQVDVQDQRQPTLGTEATPGANGGGAAPGDSTIAP